MQSDVQRIEAVDSKRNQRSLGHQLETGSNGVQADWLFSRFAVSQTQRQASISISARL
jgi:hypothetical protein